MLVFSRLYPLRKKSIIGFEALCRGINIETREVLPPGLLFESARSENFTLELDRLCRKKALEGYKAAHTENDNFILFLNLDTSIIDFGVVGSGHLLNLINALGVEPNNVVIEIVESNTEDVNSLERFIKSYKGYGFLTALDDVGCGYSNLDRVALVKPDILKIDMGIISNINKFFYKQEIFKSLVSLSKRIGALVVAEGVEREEEALVALELGADMLQGFYFSKPQENMLNMVNDIDCKTSKIAHNFNDYIINKIKISKLLHRNYNIILDSIIYELSKITLENFDSKLREVIRKYPALECIYIINENGVQVTETICSQAVAVKRGKIYVPAKKGTEHSLKDYYYYLVSTGSKKFTTDPYISLASGNLCITISSFFENFNFDRYILCIDINKEEK
ncbi:MAG: putative EAL-domain containing protein YkuI [Pelotomaculum sp. PtaU1.Bin035]|nr:MAG: putative EAL-domain containing protein YkuI [Pelotomaculum sp. PtaU1.Bin035]